MTIKTFLLHLLAANGLYATHNSVRAEICYSILMEMVTGELFVLSTHLSARACHRVKVCGHGGHTDVPVTGFGVLQAKYIRTQSPFSQVQGNKIIFSAIDFKIMKSYTCTYLILRLLDPPDVFSII